MSLTRPRRRRVDCRHPDRRPRRDAAARRRPGRGPRPRRPASPALTGRRGDQSARPAPAVLPVVTDPDDGGCDARSTDAARVPVVRLTGRVGRGRRAAPAAAAPGSPQVVRFHGGGYDQATAVAVDAAGNVYAAGSIEDGGTGAAFGVVKFDRAGTVRWAARYEGSAGGVGGSALAVTADGAGNVYAAGYVGDGVIFNTNFDFLVVKFGPTGTEQWARRYDGPARGFDQATEVVVDANGNVYVSGFSYGQNQNQAFDWSTHKYSPTGDTAVAARPQRPGHLRRPGRRHGPRARRQLVVTGFTKNTGDGMTNDVDTVAYDPAGNVAWQASWTETPTSHESPHDLDVDTAGRIAITGTTAENPSPYVVPSPVTLIYSPAGALLQAIPAPAVTVPTSTPPATSSSPASSSTRRAVPRSPSSTRPGRRCGGRRSTSVPRTCCRRRRCAPTQRRGDCGRHRHQRVHAQRRLPDDPSRSRRCRAVAAPVQRPDRRKGHRRRPRARRERRRRRRHVVEQLRLPAGWDGRRHRHAPLRRRGGAGPHGAERPRRAGISRSQIRLGWQDHAGTEDGFRIERCAGLGCSSFAEIAVVAHDTTEFVDGGLARNSHYTYRVRAFDGTATSGYTNTATGKTTSADRYRGSAHLGGIPPIRSNSTPVVYVLRNHNDPSPPTPRAHRTSLAVPSTATAPLASFDAPHTPPPPEYEAFRRERVHILVRLTPCPDSVGVAAVPMIAACSAAQATTRLPRPCTRRAPNRMPGRPVAPSSRRYTTP